MKNLILASTSTIHGSDYLEYLLPELEQLYRDVSEIVFIPYARPSGISYDEYTRIAAKAFSKIKITVRGIHEYDDTKIVLQNAKGVFVGGGNTFVLVDKLYSLGLLDVLKEVIQSGAPYLGTSAGSNICGITMKTTNDMPIVMPPSFETLGVIPFNINAHYLDPDPNSKHKGETREVRIKEFHVYNDTPVIGLREGSWLSVNDDEVLLKGNLTARFFRKDQKAIEVPSKINILSLI